MAVRDNQKMIVLTEKKLIDALTQEEASRKNINRSNVIEEILLSAMMTRNENVKSWLKNLYTEHISLKHFVEEMWQVLAEECEQNVKVKDNIVLVKIARDMAVGQRARIEDVRFNGNYNPECLNRQLSQIVDRCEQVENEKREIEEFLNQLVKSKNLINSITAARVIQNVKDEYNMLSCKNLIIDIREVIKRNNEDNKNISLEDLYKIVIEAWDYIYEYPCTYYLLLELAKLQGEFHVSWRYEIRQALVKVSQAWH